MSLPSEVRKQVREELWALADNMGWIHMSSHDKAKIYENWSRDPRIGGRLGRYMDPRRIRTYIKNSLMGGYGRERLSDESRPLRVLGLSENAHLVEKHERPHGALLEDGRIIAWGPASSWRDILLSLHERAHGSDAIRPFGMVLFRATGAYRESQKRKMVEDAATKLGVEKAVWLEG